MSRLSMVPVALLIAGLLPAQSKLLRHPTYSKGKVAFSYLGDIWIANEDGGGVARLTDNMARDMYPRFSPDGNWIAFSSNRAGNYDVYVIAATGGKAAPAHLPQRQRQRGRLDARRPADRVSVAAR